MSAVYDAQIDARMRFVLALRRAGVTDARVMAALERTPRDLFAPAGLAGPAWEDRALPLPGGASMTRPSDVARLLAAAQIPAGARTLEVGAGSGYMTAALALLAGTVVSLERSEGLAEAAAARLSGCGLEVDLRHGDGLCRFLALGPFDRIVADGAAPAAPAALLAQLAPEGIAVLAIGDPFAQRLIRFGPGPLGPAEDLGAIRLDPLVAGLA